MIYASNQVQQLLHGFFNRHEFAGVGLEAFEKVAVRDLLVALDGIGLSKFEAVFPVLGRVAAGHSIPLIGTSDIAFSGTMTHHQDGFYTDGIDGYGDTGVTPSASSIMSQNSTHISVYVKENPTTGQGTVLGAHDGTDYLTCQPTRAIDSIDYYYNNSGSFASPAAADPPDGFFVVNRELSTHQDQYQDGTRTSNHAATSTGEVSQPLYVCAQNSNGTPGAYAAAEVVQFISMGAGLTAAEITTFTTAVEAYQAALGRDRSRAGVYMGQLMMFGVEFTAAEIAAFFALDVAIEAIGASKIHAFWPFFGATASAHQFDFMNAFHITWSGSITHNASGVKGDGSSGYGDTGYNPSTQSSVTNAHIGFFAVAGTHGASSTAVMGAGGGAQGFDTMFTHGWFDGGTREIFAFSVANAGEYCPTTTETNHDGHLMATVASGSLQQRYQDGVTVSSTVAATGTGNYYNANMFILARNDGSATAFDDRTLKAAHVGDELSAAEVTILFDAITALQTALGR